jgi:phenylacetate-CoA ligase
MRTEAVDLQRQYYDLLMDSQWWSAEQLRDHQRSNLTELLRHAKQNVPFYKRRLDAVTKSSGEIDWARWNEIPIVTRQDLVDYRVAMHALVLPAGHGPTGTMKTSGSTGLSISITTCARQTLADNAARWRGDGWSGLDWSTNLCARQEIDPKKAQWPDGAAVGVWGPRWFEGKRGTVWRLYKGTSPEHLFEFLKRRNCGYLNVGARAAHALALEADRLGLEVKIDAIQAQGESCDDDDRRVCRDVFGARVINHYSSKEMGQGAHQCEHGRLHVNEENVLVEILGPDGQPCEVGVPGQVIVTPLFATAQPLIRYAQGDIITLGDPCPCGRSGRTIDKVVGRVAAIFRHPDGRATFRSMPTRAKDLLACSLVQLAQTGANHYEVRYVPIAPDAYPDEDGFRKVFHEEYFDDAKLTFVRLTEIPSSNLGKFAQYVNEYSARR